MGCISGGGGVRVGPQGGGHGLYLGEGGGGRAQQ